MPCVLRLESKQITDMIYALESFHHSERGVSEDFKDSIANIGMNYIKYIDVVVMSDGSIQIAHDQDNEDSEYDSPEDRLN